MFTACGIMHRRCCRQVAWMTLSRLPVGSMSVHYTTSCNTHSSPPEDGRNYRPKYVELIGIINKPLLFHVDGYLYYKKRLRNSVFLWLLL